MLINFSEQYYIMFYIFKYFKLHNYARFSRTCVLFREFSKDKDFKRCINYTLYINYNDYNGFEYLPNKTDTKITEQFPNITLTEMESPYCEQPYFRNFCNRYECSKLVDEFNTDHLCHVCEKYYKLCPINNCFRIIKNKKDMCIYHYRAQQPYGNKFKSYCRNLHRSEINKCYSLNNSLPYDQVSYNCINHYNPNIDYSKFY